MRKHGILSCLVVILCASALSFTTFQPDELEYQDRGNRFEGRKSKPVAGNDIELISARIAFKEDADPLPETYSLRFFMKDNATVAITVRELEVKHFYWLDQAKPPEGHPWKPGFQNFFSWPTKDVIKQLKGLNINTLGVVVRLSDDQNDGSAIRVAPAIFYGSSLPDKMDVKEYKFTFKTNGLAHLIYHVYKKGELIPVFTRENERQQAGNPYTIRWDSSHAPEGWYRLSVEGHSLTTDDDMGMTLEFYHKPVMQPDEKK